MPHHKVTHRTKTRGREYMSADARKIQAEIKRADAHGIEQVKLSDMSRGRVTIGDLTLLFQFVDARPEQEPKEG